jgi:hypothetical protein
VPKNRQSTVHESGILIPVKRTMNRSTFLKIALASATPLSAQNQRIIVELLDTNTLSQTKK